MKYFALATDYDGTLALHGKVDEPTVAALERVRASGRRLIMVTGRELDELATVCPYLDRFDLIVAENGALLFNPKTREHKLLGDPPPRKFVETLIGRGVGPISVGRAIVATWEPHEKTVLERIHELGLELQVIFNKGAVMVLPSGVNKATGLQAALQRLCLSPHNVVGIGDAENDHAFLSYCECGVAVANALPVAKEYADWVTVGDHGAASSSWRTASSRKISQGLEEKVGGRIELGKQHDGALAYGTGVRHQHADRRDLRSGEVDALDGLRRALARATLISSASSIPKATTKASRMSSCWGTRSAPPAWKR